MMVQGQGTTISGFIFVSKDCISTSVFIFCRFWSFQQETGKRLEEIQLTQAPTPYGKTK